MTTTNLETQDNLEVNLELTKQVTILSGQSLSRGAVLRYDATATTKMVAFDGTAPETVLLEDVDATAGDVVATVVRRGDIKVTEVDFGTGADSVSVRETLDAKNIFLID